MKFVIAAAAIASVNAECFEGIKMQAYSDDKCEKVLKEGDKEKEAHTVDANEATEMNKKCHEIKEEDDTSKIPGVEIEAKGMNTECDTSAITVNLFKKKDCSGDPEAHAQKWGECKKYEIGEATVYVKMTGALALQATAAAALAIIGSQF